MTRNKVMNLWTAVVTAFLALCTSLGLITTTAVAAVPATEAARNTNTPQDATAQEEPIWTRPRASSLPPTMKQRIHAEAHGSSPSCRHRPPTDAMDATGATDAMDSVGAMGAMAADTAVTRDSALAPAPAAVRAVTDATAPAAVTTADAVSAAAPVHPSGITRTTTGTVDTGTSNAKSSAGHADELPTRAPVTAAIECVLPAPAAPAAPAVDAAPAAVTLPSQSSAPASNPAPAPVQLPAPVLATAGTASQG